LGLNPWGASMVVGYGVNSPSTPHHWASLMGSGLPQGAVVGGPASIEQFSKGGFAWQGPFNSKRAAYSRDIGNYITSEPALDYSVNSVFLLTSLAALHISQ
jgi:endoglucanase